LEDRADKLCIAQDRPPERQEGVRRLELHQNWLNNGLPEITNSDVEWCAELLRLNSNYNSTSIGEKASETPSE
jgi:hypothetical protein